MLLKRISETLRSGHSREDGMAFLAVMAVMAVGLVILAIITGVLTSSFVFSSVDRADTQSQAAADSGVAVAIAGLNTQNSCATVGGVYTSNGNPRYRATIWRSADGVTFVMGCPNSTTSQVRIIATGYPQVGTVTGVVAGSTKYLEATYLYSPNGGNTTGVASSYVYNIGALDTYTIAATNGGNADVMVKTGDYSCTGPTNINGSVIVEAGNASLTNTCQVSGTVWATGTIQLTAQSGVGGNAISSGSSVTISNSTSYVTGAVYANGSVTNNGAVGGNIEAVGNVTTVGGSSVGGTIWSGGAVSIGQSMNGNIKAVGGVTVAKNAGIVLGGTITAGGSIRYNNKSNAQAVTQMVNDGVIANANQATYNQAGIVAPTPQAAPVVPAWADVVYNLPDWQAQGFNNFYTWPSALGCRVGDASSTDPAGALYPAYQTIKNLSVPSVVDLRGCSSFTGNLSLNVKTDIAFFAKDFNFDTINVTSADGAMHKLWFIVPEIPPLNSPASPVCPGNNKGGNFTINSYPSQIYPNVTATVYAPCNIATNNGTIWRGLFYSGGMNGGGGVRQLYFTPIGIPGTQVGNGNINPSNNNVGALVLKRNRTNNGE